MPRPSAWTNKFCLGQKQICPEQNHFCPAQNILSEVKSHVYGSFARQKNFSHILKVHFYSRKVILRNFSRAEMDFLAIDKSHQNIHVTNTL